MWLRNKKTGGLFNTEDINKKEYNDNDFNKIKKQKDKIGYISEKYKEKLSYPIEATKVKNWSTGDQKTGKYHYEYHAKTKNKQDIYTNSLEEMLEKIQKDIYK